MSNRRLPGIGIGKSVAGIATMALFVAIGWAMIAGAQVPDTEGRPPPGAIGENTQRIAGADRYETAVEVSRLFHEDHRGVRIAALASGEDFPDALTLGPNMSRVDEGFLSGPVLLTRRDSLPAVTVEELQRLQPCQLIVVGGAAAISDAVALEADGFTDSTQDKC